ncbi:hypothetical protein K488DRAFT_83871 [Vararia minispora EC-137]|uniref:Uncharacterized protein n=1 Tax=Vararia minispora EC-137 TaxID=1314806 RepID=A0ACB8QSQ8_9AGAM|nr:hypothetical protein K488DRAFT_83871 [Vararia minispora EC-137]
MSNTSATVLHTLPNGSVQHLPLTQIAIEAMVVDVSAHVVVSHTFVNDSGRATGRAKYVFPVPAGAAVCAFEMETSNGKFVVGEVKEKSEAEARYRTALRAGQTAGMVNWAGDDVFTISVGSIPRGTSVVAKTTFVQSLMDDSRSDEIRLQLPVSIGSARYGLPLLEAQDASSAESTTRLRFSTSIQTSGRLLDVRSPSHKGALEVASYATHRGGTPSRHRAFASFSSMSFLADDFVLAIRAEGLDAPRCFAEVDERSGTIALQLTVIPKFDIPRPPVQEYLFLVDRSGSMAGDRIRTAKQALKTILHIIPCEGSYVNIFSFGSDCDNGLWPMSHPYDPFTLQSAMLHVDGMDANMGGTEILPAVAKVLKSRTTTVSTIIYVLTDGLVQQGQIDATMTVVSDSVQQASRSGTHAPLRVFTLGIGSEVSTALCEGLARAGRGIPLFAVDSSEILQKCSRLVGAGIHPIISSISVDWAATLTGDQPATDSVLGVELQPHPPILQSPPRLTTLYRNHRFIIHAILRANTVPHTVILRGKVQNGQTEDIELPVPVRLAKRFSSLVYSSAFLHTLAARSVIRDVRENERVAVSYTPGATYEEVRRAEIVRLGVRYQLTSEFTSFVGVDEGDTVDALRRAWRSRRAERRRNRYRGEEYASSAVLRAWGAMSNVISGAFSWIVEGANTPARGHSIMPGQLATPSSSSRSSRSRMPRPDSDQEDEADGYWTDDSISTMSSLESYVSVMVFRPGRQRWVRWPPPFPPVPRVPSPDVHATATTSPLVPRSVPRPDDLRLIELQAFDGSFPASAEVMAIMGRDAATEATVAAQLDVDEDIWATILVAEYLERTLQDQPELLDGLLVKVLEFVERKVGRASLENLRARAKGIRSGF